MSVATPSMTRLKTLFDPVKPGSAIELGYATSASVSTTRQTYDNASTATLWNSGKFNKQGQKWAAANSGNPSAGVQNRGTNRGLLGNYAYHQTECEFIFTGKNFDVQFYGTTTGYDISVWMECGDGMHRLDVAPLWGTYTTAIHYLNVVLPRKYTGRIRVHVGGAIFVGIGHDQSAIVKPSPVRPFYISDGDSYGDGMHAQNAADHTEAYFTLGLNDFVFEKTGFVAARRAQGGTGFFTNGSGSRVTNDSAEMFSNSTRIGSAPRRAWMVDQGPAPFDFSLPLGQRPLFYWFNGTWNDGQFGLGRTDMASRCKAVYQAIRDLDKWCTIVHLGIEPYWGDAAGGYGAAGTITGPPTAGSNHDLHNLGIQDAIREMSLAYFVNAFGPADPWFTGKGDSTTLATDPNSPQAQLTGSDHIHGNAAGYDHYAELFVSELGEMLIPTARALGHV